MSILRYFNKHQGWYGGKRTPFGCGGGIVSAITDPISNVLGTDGGGGGILGGLAQLDKTVGNTIPGGWATVGSAALLAAGVYDPTLLGMADAGTLTPEAMANAGVDQATIDTIGTQGATAAGNATGGVAVDATGLPIETGGYGFSPAEIAAGSGTPATSGLPAGSAFTPQEIAAGQGVQGIGPNLAGTAGANIPAATAAGAAGGTTLGALGGNLGTALGVSAGANALSSLLGANASNKAAQIQANAANNASQLTANMFNIQNQQQQPYRTAGYGALNQINSMLPGNYVQYDANGNPVGAGTGTGYLTHQFNAQDLNANMSPGYAFQLQQGQQANLNAANALGGRVGGNALQGLQNYTQGLASTGYQNAFNNYQSQRQNIYNTLAGIAGIGQTSQQQTGNLAQNAATTQGQLGVGGAAAQAAGQTGVASALAGGAQGITNNLLLASLLGQNQGAAGA